MKACKVCGKDAGRSEKRGPKPSYCAECRRLGLHGRKRAADVVFVLTCKHCSREFEFHRKKQYCSTNCRHRHRKVFVKLCGYCQADFTTTRIESIFCSARCVQRAKGHNAVIGCPQCGLWFERPRPEQVFCSKKCSAIHQAEQTLPERSILREAAEQRGQQERMQKIFKRTKLAPCPDCGRNFNPFIRSGQGRKRCSPCTKEHARQRRLAGYIPRPKVAKDCRLCGKSFASSRPKAKYCSHRCSRKAEVKKRWAAFKVWERERRRLISSGELIDPIDIFERDGWVCQLCHKKVKRDAAAPHPLAPTMDHIVPVADGGEHVEANVQCAHFICNCRRSNIGPAQRRLFV